MALYNDAPPVSFSLGEFTTLASQFTADEDYDAFIRFTLTGEFVNDAGHVRQAFVDPIREHVDESHPLSVSHDYDSVIGISDDILVDGQLSVNAVPHPTHALKKSIHITRAILYDGVRHDVEYHRIPNFEFGTFGPRHNLNIFFPGLWTPERSTSPKPYQLTEAERASWYDKGLRPAIQFLLGAVVSEWPATYQTEEIRARKTRGGHAWGTRIIQRDVVGLLMERVNLQVLTCDDDALDWAMGAFVMHTIRGVKHGTIHRADFYSASHYLDDFFEYAKLVPDASQRGDWYVDVGIQISSDLGQSVQWMTATHRLVVQQALRISEEHATRVTQVNSSKYSRDLSSHLSAVSGFRIVPGPRAAGVFEAAYIQAYTTDKTVVYHPEGTHYAKYLTTKEALDTQQPTETISGIHDIYEKARTLNPSSARLEIRVPYRFAVQTLLEFDPDVLRGCLCVFKTDDWWGFRTIRLMAISQVLGLQQGGLSVHRFTPEALTLTAACVWLFNGLHARPDDGPASRSLMDATLPLVEAEGANPEYLAYNTSVRLHDPREGNYFRNRVPYIPSGCIFLRRIMLPDVPRMRHGGTSLSPSGFKFWFHNLTVEELRGKYSKSGIVDRKTIARSTSNKSKMPLYVNLTGIPEPNIFQLASRGFELPNRVQDDLSDVEDLDSPPPADGPQDIDGRLSSLWRQFVCDLTSKSPNQQGITNPSYLKLNDIERRSGSEMPYMNLCLPELFVAVYYKQASREEWERSFKWLFPPLGYKTSSSTQNYPKSPYFRQWMELLEANADDPNLIENIRTDFFKRIRKWSWIPHAQVDKMWPTGAKKASSNRFTRWPAAEGRPPAPHILLKSNGIPELSTPPDDVIEID